MAMVTLAEPEGVKNVVEGTELAQEVVWRKPAHGRVSYGCAMDAA